MSDVPSPKAPSPKVQSFDNVALAAAVRRFAQGLDAKCVERVEVTLSGRGPIERLFAVEAALEAGWPRGRRRPPRDLVSSTGELSRGEAPLTLRAFGPRGAVVLCEACDLAGEPVV